MDSTVITPENEVIEAEAREKAVSPVTGAAPITAATLARYPEEKQKEIVALADAVDVLQFDKVKAYGSIPVLRTIESCDKILKEYEGTTADKEVIRQVIELAKQANQTYDDFNLELVEPKGLRKLFSKVISSIKGDDEELKLKALSCFKVLYQLSEACETWEDMLKRTYEATCLSGELDKQTCYELQEYIVAGKIAEERIIKEVEQAKAAWEDSGMLEDRDKYDALREGLEVFQVVLHNLEKSLVANALSTGQLALVKKGNERIQIAVQTQKTHSIAVAKQQVRNAVLDAANRDALEGQKSVATLNSELMKKVSSSAVLTAKEAEEAIYNGIYTIEAAMEAATTVINGCKEIEAVSADMKAAVAPELEKLKSVFDELAPFVSEIRDTKGTTTTTSSNSKTGGLVF